MIAEVCPTCGQRISEGVRASLAVRQTVDATHALGGATTGRELATFLGLSLKLASLRLSRATLLGHLVRTRHGHYSVSR